MSYGFGFDPRLGVVEAPIAFCGSEASNRGTSV